MGVILIGNRYTTIHGARPLPSPPLTPSTKGSSSHKSGRSWARRCTRRRRGRMNRLFRNRGLLCLRERDRSLTTSIPRFTYHRMSNCNPRAKWLMVINSPETPQRCQERKAFRLRGSLTSLSRPLARLSSINREWVRDLLNKINRSFWPRKSTKTKWLRTESFLNSTY